jgi:hypothetical protein
MLLFAIAPLLALAVNVIVHVSTYRFRFTKSMLRAVYTGFFLGLSSLFVLNIYLLWELNLPALENVSKVFLSISTYAILSYGYFHFNNLGETARRIRILREFIISDGMNFEELRGKYSSKEMMKLRLDRLVRAGQIVISEDGQIKLNGNLVLGMARVIVLLKIILLKKKTSEFVKRGL